MDISDYMSDAARAFCLSAGHAPLRGEPFSKLELNAQLSFVLDNPTLPIGSRKTWDMFIKQTGSKRNSGDCSLPYAHFHSQQYPQIPSSRS